MALCWALWKVLTTQALNRTAMILDKVALKVCSTNSLQNDMGGFGVRLT